MFGYEGKTVLATGAAGMVGAYLPDQVVSTDIESLDVTDAAAVGAALDEHSPDVVIHLAAETNVDLCEQDPDHAYRVNALGTANVARVCGARGVELVYISSGQVFDGEKHDPYHEYDDPRPVTVYGRSKLAGEWYVRQFAPRSYVVRAGWMIGGGPHGEKKFIAKMLDHAERMKRIVAVDDKLGTPTYAADLVRVVGHLLDGGQHGLFHCVNPGAVSRYDIALVVRDVLGLDYEVEAVKSTRFPLPAPRGRSEVMDNLVLRTSGMGELMAPWREALTAYLRAEWLSAVERA